MGKQYASSVELDKGIIRVVVAGEVTEIVMSGLIAQIQRYIDDLLSQGKKVFILANINTAGEASDDAQNLAKAFFRKAKYDRIAIVDGRSESNETLGFMVNTIGSVLRIKLFRTDARATRWLRAGQMTPQTKAKWLFGGALLLAIVAGFWLQFTVPYLLSLPSDFSYKASVVSHDNFYNEQEARFSGVAVSSTTFSYEVTSSHNNIADIRNLFDVRTIGGDKIFAVERTYGIDQTTRTHVPDSGDRARTGYLFAPRHLDKQDFTYWHVNYDAPARMKFQDEEVVQGLTTYRYVADYRADQTSNLKHLPGVGVTRGVDVDVNLRLWVEPQTGHLIKYEDFSTAYYYDLATHARLNPWNQFSNSYNFDSITAHVSSTEKEKRIATFIENIVPLLLVITTAILALRAGYLLWRAKHAPTILMLARASGVIVAGTALAVMFGWITHNTTLTRLSPSFSVMHILTAVNFILITAAFLITLLKRKGRRIVWLTYLLLALVAMSSLVYLCRFMFGFDIGLDTILASLGLPSITSISPVTAVCFIILSLVLLLNVNSRINQKTVRIVAPSLLGLTFALALVAIAGYAFSLEYLYTITLFRSMALHTAILFTVLVIGIFAGHEDWTISRRLKRVDKSLFIATSILVVALTITGLLWQQSIANTSKQADIQFQGSADSLHTTISGELMSYIKALQGARGLFAASVEVDRTEWKAYVDGLGLSQNYPGMQGMGFVEVAPVSKKVEHTAKARQEGLSSYAIHPDTGGEIYSSVVFLEPQNERNSRAFGYDMLSDSARRAVMEQARDTGEATMSGKVTLVQETGVDPQSGLLIYLPVYRHGAPLSTIAERRAALAGFVYTPIRVTDFMRATIGEQSHGLNIGLFDTKTPTKLTLEDRLYVINKQYGIENTTYNPKFVLVQPMPIAGHTLTLRYSSLPTYDFGSSQTLPVYVLFIGVLLSFMLATLIFLLSTSRIRALRLADGMTKDLRNERDRAVIVQAKDEAILSSIGDGVFVIDPLGKIVLFNQAAEQISGFTAKEALGQAYQNILVFVNSKDGRAASGFIHTALSGRGAEMAKDTIIKRKDGTSLPVADSAAPIIDAEGALEGAVVVFRDVTQEKQLEHMKDEFLSVASHELRTPMGAVRANLSMILAGDYGPVNKELVEPLTDMKVSTVRLVELVNDLLSVARIEAGRMHFALSEFELREAVRSVVDSLAPLGKENGIQISLKSGPTAIVQADIDKVKQVLTNLIGNSLKFTDKGKITIALDVQKNEIEVTVKDTGIGISSDDQKKLFSKFNQITSAQAGKPPGTGLGLYISREIIQKMGGKLWIKESTPGEGSTFAFTIPRAQSQIAKKAQRTLEREAELHPDQK